MALLLCLAMAVMNGQVIFLFNLYQIFSIPKKDIGQQQMKTLCLKIINIEMQLVGNGLIAFAQTVLMKYWAQEKNIHWLT